MALELSIMAIFLSNKGLKTLQTSTDKLPNDSLLSFSTDKFKLLYLLFGSLLTKTLSFIFMFSILGFLPSYCVP